MPSSPRSSPSDRRLTDPSAIAPTREDALILQLVTDRRRLAGERADWNASQRCLLEQAAHAIEAGVDMIQIRERDLEASDLSRLVAAVVRMARGTGTRVVVNDRLDVALSCGAAGVHLRTDSMPPSAARSIVPQGFLVGRSVHDAAEAAAVAPFVDYVIAGTIWPSESKGPGPPVPPPIGPAGLRAIARVVSVPVLAIGGVTLETIAEAAAAGAAGIAAIGLFMRSRGQPGEPVCRAMPLGSAVEQARERFDTPHRAS